MKALSSAVAFDRAMRHRPVAKTSHFLLHHSPCDKRMGSELAAGPQLSTGLGRAVDCAVDESPVLPRRALVVDTATAVEQRLGLIVPKRHARRAVTRSLVRRQAKSVLGAFADRLSAGDWVLRLRQGFDVRQFPSAASDALRRAVRAELMMLVTHASHCSPRVAPGVSAAQAR